MVRCVTDALEARSMIVRAADRIPIECVVRGFLAGSGWAEYQRTNSVAGHRLPEGLQLSSRLPEPIFTPAIKNDTGHDENVTVDQLRAKIGSELASHLEAVAIAIYRQSSVSAAERGVIIADTKLEFGFIDGALA